MKNQIIVAQFLFSLGLGGVVHAQSLIPAHIGVQWPVRVFNFSDRCGSPNLGGHNCVHFPNGAVLHAVGYEYVLKQGPGEILLALIVDGVGAMLHKQLNSTGGPERVDGNIALPKPVRIPPGANVWLYGEGSTRAASGSAPVEVQMTLFVEPTQWVQVQ